MTLDPRDRVDADAMSGERERLMSMGMDGYASKPIEQGVLINEVHRVMGVWTGTGATQRESAAPDLHISA
jgi:hypothetical protein